MSEPFLGEIRRVAFAYPPNGWAMCNGQFLSIAQNQALFSLLGTAYGGNGTTTFQLPDLRGRSPLHPGADGILIGSAGGAQQVTLQVSQLPSHMHLAEASSAAADVLSPQGAYWAAPSQAAYGTGPGGSMSPAAVAPTGANAPHENQSPYLVINYIIALVGIYPSRD